MSDKKSFAIDVCKAGNTKSTCTFKERMEFFYYKNKSYHRKLIVQCCTVGDCDDKKQAIMTIEEEETYDT